MAIFIGFLGLMEGLTGCSSPTAHPHPPAQPLPTHRVLPGSVFKVQKTIQSLFKTGAPSPFLLAPEHPPLLTLYWKGKKHPPEVTIFRSTVNENDVYVSCNHGPICRTRAYTDRWGNALELVADLQLHLIPQGAKETLVKVVVIGPEVIAGQKFGFGSCGPGMANVYEKVQPTTLEEDAILNALEKALKKK